MRGTPLQETHRPRPNGIIPAYAGNTDQSIILFPSCGDHPRVCGEHYQLRGCRNRSRDHPRVCGEHLPIDTGEMLNARDHPRVCGEHATGASTQVNCTGSSPRMRGTQRIHVDFPLAEGIIPAYAGNTLKCATMYTWVRDHPRVCGEHAHRNDNGTNDMGSSPRMRGTHPDIFVCADTKGIIPAYAGNTEPPTASQPLNRDHPRVCGEHPSINGVHPLSGGSSPRMRGTLTSGCDVSIRIGIIPAYAGNTARCSRMSLGSRDHPRVCGEHEDTRL